MLNLLILDDDPIILKVSEISLGKKYRVIPAASFDSAIALLDKEDIDGAVIDINLKDPDHDGLEFLERFKAKFPDKPVIMESGYKDIPTVVKCMKAGADDYLEKPFEEATLHLKLDRVFKESQKLKVFKRAFEKSSAINQIVGTSAAISKARDLVIQAQDMRVLFYGETGVGKTPFAWLSNQVVNKIVGSERPFEQVNCAALNNEQFQDQLFGHKKGAFTGAIADKRGLVEIAKGGDLFLDEIGDMPLETQANFLTFLDSMEYYRLGDDKKRKAEVRVICATNKDLKKMVQEGQFRQDLYSRISQVVVNIPPLRERKEDIRPIFEYFLEQNCGVKKPYDDAIISLFEKFAWDEGNVRELRDAVEYLCIMSRNSERILVEHLSDKYRPSPGMERLSEENAIIPDDMTGLFDVGLESYLGHLEKQILQKNISQYSGNLGDLAKELKISRPTLYRRIKKYDIAGNLRMDD